MAELINYTGPTLVESGTLDNAIWIEGLAKVMYPVWMERGLFITLGLVNLPKHRMQNLVDVR